LPAPQTHLVQSGQAKASRTCQWPVALQLQEEMWGATDLLLRRRSDQRDCVVLRHRARCRI